MSVNSELQSGGDFWDGHPTMRALKRIGFIVWSAVAATMVAIALWTLITIDDARCESLKDYYQRSICGTVHKKQGRYGMNMYVETQDETILISYIPRGYFTEARDGDYLYKYSESRRGYLVRKGRIIPIDLIHPDIPCLRQLELASDQKAQEGN